MQNKTKIFLVVMGVLGFGVFWSGDVLAADCVCGSANNQSSVNAPTTNLCSTGTASSIDTEDAIRWEWTCIGDSCGTVSCSATKAVDLNACACGSANGQSFATTPTSNLCSTGTTSSVTGSGPWTWSCTGSCGASASCSANKTGTTPTPGTGIEIPTDTGLPANTGLVKGILTNVANWLLGIIGIIAIIGFVISGLQYFLVATDEKMLETAKKTAQASAIGIAVALSGYIVIAAIEKILKGTSLF
ncbi:MAG: hypothetical protein WA064_05365 [Candidatus Moraniibacteriota bacterium]